MVGVRVLVGSQSIDRAPSYINIFGRTLPVILVFIIICYAQDSKIEHGYNETVSLNN